MASHEFPVAVIGMAVKLPGANNCNEFWELMVDQKDTVSTFPPERAADVEHVLPAFKGQFVDEASPFFTGSFFKSVDQFDADLFGVNPKEAMFIEPEQRMFLEAVWDLLEDAGYASKIRNSNTGVYVGNTVNKYKYILTENHPSISHGNHSPFISSRVSYTFNLSGPAMMVATGCSSSLLAVHLACQGLLSGDCDMAIAGGITLDLLPISLKTDIWNQLGITSPNAKCRAFDAKAKGIAKAEGCGIVLLKPLAKAIADGDNIYGVLEATTANQDGHSQGITAPHPGAQSNMLTKAWELAGITPDLLGYIEAHGTGTELGDPIEIMGITKAYQKMAKKTGTKQDKIPIGSVKANIGHLADGAAGVVSLIKVLLCLNKCSIPPVTNFSTPNPHINWERAPVMVNETLRKWENTGPDSRYGGVSAFGLLGTNIHAVVKEYKPKSFVHRSVTPDTPHLLCIAAKTRHSLKKFVTRLMHFMEENTNMSLEHFSRLCYTLNTGRELQKFQNRLTVVSNDAQGMTQALQSYIKESRHSLDQRVKERITRVDPTTKQSVIIESFLKRHAIDWQDFYRNTHESLKVPVGMLPTYAFEKTRYWPDVSETLNKQYLLLEHQIPPVKEDIPFYNEEIVDNEPTPTATDTQDISSEHTMDPFSVLSEAFNNALGNSYDWLECGNKNLFALGVDSLVYTHLTMQLMEAFNNKSEIMFTQADLHSRPTFNEMCRFIEEKLKVNPQSSPAVSPPTEKNETNEFIGIDETIPLSFSQRRLWVIEKMEKAGCTYNATNCLKITGKLDVEAFKRSVYSALRRHDAFFITIQEKNSEPYIEYDWKADLDLEEKDMTSQSEYPEVSAMASYETDYKVPFNLSAGPLVRTKLYRLGKEQYLFTMVIHHIVFDGWSHFALYNEIWDNYTRSIDGQTLPEGIHKPMSSKFSKLELADSLSKHSKMQKDMSYWIHKLSTPLQLTTFPCDRKRPQTFTYEGGRLTRFIDMTVFKNLNSCVRDSHTMFHSILASVFVLLQYFNPAQTDFVVGIPVTGRHVIEMRDVIGCFINTLVIRVSMDKTKTFSEIVQSVAKTCFEAQEHQMAPFDHLVSKLKLSRNTSITPVFSVNVCYHNEELKHGHVQPPDHLEIERKLLHNNTSKWDVQFDFLEEGDQMRFTLEYYKGIFSEDYAQLIADMLVQTMEMMTQTPDVPMLNTSIGEPSIMVGPKVSLGMQSLTDQLIDSLDAHPESVIKDQYGHYHTYTDLKRDSTKTANFFVNTCRLRKGDHVGLLFENSYEGLQVMTACLMIGVVYVPLNPDNPKARLEQIVRSSRIKLICFTKDAFTLASYLQWSCEEMGNIFCINYEDVKNVTETHENPLMDTELWNCVAEESTTDIEGGGWKSSFTGEHMTTEEMNDYVNNVVSKLEEHVDTETFVLEIGCASGLTTQALCSKVKEYVATDLSETMIKRLMQKNLENVQAHCIPAHEISDAFKEIKFDLIIINSVVHCFPGYNYLRKVIEASAGMLTIDGKIFVGDVMDLKKRDDLEHALKSFKASNPKCRTKTDLSAELFLPEEFFESFEDIFPSVVYSPKIGQVENELTKYRYDVLLTKEARNVSRQHTKKQIFSASDIETGSKDVFLEKVNPNDDAYILFTSGTTGTPKGVRISQKALLNYCTWAKSAYCLNTDTRMPLFSPLTFDFTVTSIFPPLLQGSTIEIFKSFANSYDHIAASDSLTVAKFSPLQLESMLADATKPLNMSIFVLGGEELTFPLLKKLKENKQDMPFKVWNEYGPTEATIGCVVRCIDSTEITELEEQNIPIGKPIDNVTVAVVNGGKPVPLGTKGFLAIGGPCLTSGFLNSKKETIDAFSSACWNQNGSLMYTTTDIVSCSVDKQEMFYFGRDSTDITKINGIRVDISEVQASIRKIAFVEDAWACKYEMEGSTFLGAAVKLVHNACYKDEDLRNTITKDLTQILPLYCIPKAIVQLSEPPTNKNGKKDTALLKTLFVNAMARSTKHDDSIPNETERKVQTIWQEILPVERMPGLNEDFFFELSGDSLQAIHLVRKLRNAGFSVMVNDIFRNPTIKSLCRSMCSNVVEKIHSEYHSGTIEPFRPTPIAERYMLTKRDSDRFAVPALLELRNPLTLETIQKALQAVMIKHKSLSSRFYVEDGQVFQQYVDVGDKPSVIEATLSKDCENLVEDPNFTKTCNDLEHQLDIDDGNLLNAAIFRSDGRNYCLIVIHHISVDIVSWQQLLEDLSQAMEQAHSGKIPVLSPASAPFHKYCEELWKEGKACQEEELEYWKEVTKAYKNDVFQTENIVSLYGNAKWESQSVDAHTVRQLSIAIGCTDESVILTALGQSFSKLEGSPLTVCLESHGRQIRLDTTDTVGWCTSMFPFMIKTKAEDDFVSATKKVRDHITKVPLHGVRYGPAVGVGKMESELPNTMFVFQGSLDASSKVDFKAGDASFKYLPWVEVLTHDLENGHYHRDDRDLLDFPLEVICWFHSNNLRIGSLFDSKKVSSEWVQALLHGMKNTILEESRKINLLPVDESLTEQREIILQEQSTPREDHSAKRDDTTQKSKSVQILSNIVFVPEALKTTKSVLSSQGLKDTEIVVKETSEFYQCLLQEKPSSHFLTLALIRCTQNKQRDEIQHALYTFSKRNQGTDNKLIILILESIPQSIPMEMEETVSFVVKTVQFEKEECDVSSAVDFNIPLNQQGYAMLSIAIARTISACLKPSDVKVICVDGDYTLWNGECANNDVQITEENVHFQKFLLQKMHEGYLIVLLSKNRLDDVLALLENREMILKQEHFVHLAVNWQPKHVNIIKVSEILGLNLQSFVFIDDNVTECEQMLRIHPNIKTLRIPTKPNLIKAFTSSLWFLDKIDITSEATNRTQLYRSEVARMTGNVNQRPDEDETNQTLDLQSLLHTWGMKIQIWKTSIQDLQLHQQVSRRVSELLHRTNQFKLNDRSVKLEDFSNTDECLVVSLEDDYGKYGIVSAIIVGRESASSTIKQWVLSCRALGRKVEERLVYEVLHQIKNSNMPICLHFRKTGKNIPMENFLRLITRCPEATSEENMILDSERVYNINESLELHEVCFTADPSFLLLNESQSNENAGHCHKSVVSNNVEILKDFSRWIKTSLSNDHVDHISSNHVLPKFLLDDDICISQGTRKTEIGDVSTLEQIWMRILKLQQEPQSLDTFVKLGGNSFQAVFLISEIFAAFGIKVELIDILTKSFSWLEECVKRSDEQTVPDKMIKHTMNEIELSQAQKRMWMLQMSSESSTAYTETIALKIEANITLGAIVAYLSMKHPLLLATLDKSGNSLRIQRDAVNVEKREFKDVEDLMKYLLTGKPVFDKAEEPLSQFVELKCDTAKVFALHVHHLLVDDITLHNIKMSVRNKVAMLSDHPEVVAEVEGQVALNKHFEDCVKLEKEYMRSGAFENDRLFWESRFENCPEETSFSLKQTEDISEFVPKRAEIATVSIPNEVVSQIQYMCQKYGVTEFQYILACFTLVAQRYTAKEEIVLAVPVSIRNSDTMETDGLFVNTVLFRHKVSMEHTLEEHIKAIADEWIKSFSHSRCPIDYVGQIIWERFGTSLSSICNTMFNFATFQKECDDVEVKPKHAKMPFSVDVIKDKNGWNLVCEYAEELVQRCTVDNILGALERILNKGKAHAQTKLRELEFLQELNTLDSFSMSKVEVGSSRHVFEMFSRNAESSPDSTALCFKGKKTSYKELIALVNAIASQILHRTDTHALQQKPVLIYMDKTERAIASMFAVWKIGGFFMPLSTMYVSNIEDIIGSVNPCLVLVGQTLNTPGGRLKDIGIINVNDVHVDSTPKAKACAMTKSDIDQPAYMIRTSGSTGKPKNILIGHKGLAVVASAWESEYEMSEFQVNLLQWAPLSFDVFIGDIVRGLCCAAGKLVICPDNMRLDTDYILSLIVEEQISIAEVTPQFGLMLSQRATNKELSALRIFILGSDTLQKEVYLKIKRNLSPKQRLLNSYGMTEATIDSSFFEGDTLPMTRGGVIPVGKPLPGVVLKVLDPNSLLPCPVGVVGELHIGGDVVGKGEVNTIEMKNGERLLKTCDYACWLESGDLELCGRKDTMCKLRGFRIDSSHIENTILGNCDAITDVTVTVLTDKLNGQENDYLCAFIVKSPKETDTTDLVAVVKDKVRSILPYYMVPDFIECVAEIPLSHNGKVDRKRLPPLKELLRRRKINQKSQQFTNNVTNELKALFAESLGVEIRCIDDDHTFMEQGGHSLILMKFCSLIKERTDLQIGIVDIFSYPSLTLLTEKAMRTSQNLSTKRTAIQPDDHQEVNKDHCDIAICGVGFRLPNGICSIADFWQLLENQTNLISSFPKHRKDDVLDCSDPELSSILRDAEEFKGAFLSDIDKFDNEAFSISSTESQSMAPEQRIFLEVASETLAQGTDISKINGSNIGVFLSQTEIGYARLNHQGEATAISGLMQGMIATRVAYHYNLKGPTMLIDTACSSGISALKAACSSIQKGECNAALVGGMNLVLYPSRTGVHGNNGILSPDFVCRPFDKNANGTGVGEGVICYYVEPLENALKQNKHVYGVIKSIGTNSVGRGNGITAPTAQSQTDVIQSALDQAGISSRDISYIEAHGTGTLLGDKIELTALSTVFNNSKQNLPIGSVKSNLGHLDSAAGLAGLLKIITGYMFEQIPPSANFKDPHKELTDSVLHVSTKPEPWRQSEKLRFAGLSSFGLTGTNTHMIVSDAIRPDKVMQSTWSVPLLLCGANHGHIRKQAILFKKLIHQTVVKHKINTVQEISISIANKLDQLQKSRLLHTEHRVVILETTADELLRSLGLIIDCEDAAQLDNIENNCHIYSTCPGLLWDKQTQRTDITTGLEAFLTSSVINTDSLLGDCKLDPLFCAPGVVLSMFNSKRHWLRPCLKAPQSSLGLIDILHGKVSKTRELVRTLNLTPSEELLQYEARFCCSIILDLLKETRLKEDIESQRDITMEESFTKTGMMDKYDKLFFIMIRELLNLDYVEAKGSDSGRLNLDIYSFRCRDIVLPSPKQIAEEAMSKYTQWADCFRFPLHCSKHLKQVLWGHLSPLSVIYPQGDLNFMYQFDKLGDMLGDVYYNMYMQIIVEYAARLSAKGKTVRILEVGAGMGHVTRQLLPSLAEIPNIEYWFTDLGRAFVENAKTLFEKYTYMMRFSTFDITKNAVKQGLLGSYDIVISYNVIHTTESVCQSVNNLRTCLGEDGTLFVIESAKNETWATLAWGILDGWWYFKDYDLRPYEPMLEPEKWEEVLQKSGFSSIHSCPMDPDERKHVEKFLFVCTNKPKRAEFIPAPTDGWWKCIDLTAHRHADFDTDSSCSDESGLGDEGKVSKSIVKLELKRIWCELLDLEDIDDDEDFNSLGGESLLAIQMMTMVRKRIGFQLEIADTFCYTSLGSLGEYISDQLEAEASEKSNTESSSNSSDNEIPSKTTIPSQFPQSDAAVSGCLLMFPGQGSQKIGMCKSMKDSVSAKRIFNLAEEVLGYNILDICTGPEHVLTEKLQSTEFVQVALFVSCLAKISQLQSDQPEVLQSVTHVAGLSVGEFAALVYADVLKFEDALQLVQRRGRAMEREVAKASTAMASVLGPQKDTLELFLQTHIPAAVISTCLADNQHTVAGTEGDIELLISMLSESTDDKLNVIDIRRLRVAGAFHSAYMIEAEREIKHLIDQCEFKRPEVPIILNVTGGMCDDPREIKTLISRQIVESVQWRDSMVTAHAAGVRKFIEVAPARVLSSIVRTRIEKCKGCVSELIQI